MKWYIASRRKHAGAVRQLFEILKKEGHEIISDWTQFGKIELTPENRGKNAKLADMMGYATTNSDIVVLISDPEGTDMYLEAGMAIGKAISVYHDEQKPMIYCVGEHGWGSLVQHHPAIQHVDYVKEVFMRECPEIAQKYSDKLATIDGMLKDAPAFKPSR